MDFTTGASQNGFITSKPSIHKKTNIIQKMTKMLFFITFICNNRAIVKQDHYMTHLLSYMQSAYRDAAVSKTPVI